MSHKRSAGQFVVGNQVAGVKYDVILLPRNSFYAIEASGSMILLIACRVLGRRDCSTTDRTPHVVERLTDKSLQVGSASLTSNGT